MHINPSGENYLETILILSKKLPVVRSVDIATELDFKKPSVSVAMKKLRTSGHIIVSPEGYIQLTESGKKLQTRFMNDIFSFLPGWNVWELTPKLQHRTHAGSNMLSVPKALKPLKNTSKTILINIKKYAY